jgi:hypothetical protein
MKGSMPFTQIEMAAKAILKIEGTQNDTKETKEKRII